MCVLSQVLFDATLSGHFAMGTLCSTADVASPPVTATVTATSQSVSPACVVDFVLRSRDLSASGDTMDTLKEALSTGKRVRSITGYV